ncbi:MAG: polysaccharide lyase 6 family protein [Lysobacterales bacterium]
MRYFSYSMFGLLLILGVFAGSNSHAATIRVSSQSEYHDATENLQPGDTVELANGEWTNFEIVFSGTGQKDKPITLTAEEKGKVFITGVSNLRIAGEYLVVSGLVFKDGYTPTSEVVSFRRNKENLANNSRITEVVIDGFNNPERTESDYWVSMYGKNNRFDHNYLAGKNNNGVTMAVRLNSEASQLNRHRIDHNYFGHRPILGSNGGETLRIGTSHYSMSNSFTVVENNYFDRCDGEVEIISNKSGGNVIRGNVFFESRGTLTLRHGNDNLVENNVFFGNGVDHTGGIRVINKRQMIRNNYMEGLTGTRFGSAFVIMNGVPDSPINRYHQVENTTIINNTIINASHIELAAGSDSERSAVPKTTRFNNNLVYNEDGKDPFTIHDDISGIKFKGNVHNEMAEFQIGSGFSSRDIKLIRQDNGLLVPAGGALKGKGIDAGFKVLDRSETGPDWYPKPEKTARFDTGQTHTIEADGDQLIKAVANAKAGDVIELKPGNYLVEKIISLDKAVTIRAMNGEKPTLEFERTTFFEILEGGALKLEGLIISGKSAPDVAGNSLVRTSRYSMLDAYDLIVKDCEVRDLDVNHSFNFLTVAKGTFAEHIEIHNSSFSNITGAILPLDRETDDLGLYNAEYVVVTNSTFNNIGKAMLTIYRGGTDESTFGPHVEISDTSLVSVGNNKRNKTGASVHLHGIQVVDIKNNKFKESKPIRVVQTVGEPVTRISNNNFVATPAPEIINGTAVLEGNTVSEVEKQ